jgi:phosphinothricin acetyltransferase
LTSVGPSGHIRPAITAQLAGPISIRAATKSTNVLRILICGRIEMLIRDADESDVVGILPIRNHAIVHSTATWTEEVESLDDCSRWLAERRAADDAVVVAEEHGTVVGYGAYTRWRPKWGYRYTAADSVYVVDGYQGQGIGKMLLVELIARATTAGMHVMIADIESTNVASIKLHSSLGFTPAGTLPQIGWKFDRWLDLSMFTLRLN